MPRENDCPVEAECHLAHGEGVVLELPLLLAREAAEAAAGAECAEGRCDDPSVCSPSRRSAAARLERAEAVETDGDGAHERDDQERVLHEPVPRPPIDAETAEAETQAVLIVVEVGPPPARAERF